MWMHAEQQRVIMHKRENSKRQLLYGWTQPETYDTDRDLWPQFVRGDGPFLYDRENAPYIDAKSSMKCVSFGHSVPEIVEAAQRQMALLAYTPALDHSQSPVAEKLAGRLADLTGGQFPYCYLSSTGTAAVENAIMLSLTYWKYMGRLQKKRIVSLETSYHGQSLKLKSVCASKEVKTLFNCHSYDSFQSVAPNCAHCPFQKQPNSCGLECAASLERNIVENDPNTIALLLIEPVASENMVIPPDGYFERIRSFTEKHEIHLVFDEVITGFGRLGTTFAYEYFAVLPDILCLGKSIDNGVLPLAATCINQDIHRVLHEKGVTMEFGSTQDGNPVACAAAVATIDFLQRHSCAANAARMGTKLLDSLKERLSNVSIVRDIRGVGLFIGIELDQSRAVDENEIRRLFKQQRIFVHVETCYVLIAPPLTITEDLVTAIANRVEVVLRGLSGSHNPNE